MASESVGSCAPHPSSPPPAPPTGGVATTSVAVSPVGVRYTQTTPNPMPNIKSSPLPVTTGERGVCFKCNQEGHWARSCPMKRGIPASPSSAAPACGGGRSEFPDFRCSCGTTVYPKQSHTEKNPNRWFYSCSKCSFWKWCDKVVSPGPMHGSASPLTPTRTPKTPDTDKKHLSGVSKNLEHVFDASGCASPTPSPNERQSAPGTGNCPAICRCGVLCQVLTSHTNQNPNRRFCKCAKQAPEGCRFFEWCDEHVKKTDEEKLRTTPFRLENAIGAGSPTGASTPANAGNISNVPIRTDCGAKVPLEVDPTHGVSSVPECACGAGKCCLSEVTEGEYVGRSYYSCPIKKGQGACNFFKFVETPANPQETKKNIVGQNDIPTFQLIPNIQSPQKKDPSPAINIKGPSLSPNKVAVKAGACFRCGQEGHWASECKVSQRAKYA